MIPNQPSSSVEVYSKVSNFFDLEYRLGKTYAILAEPGAKVSDDHTVFVEGKLYSSRPKGNSVLVTSPPIEVTDSNPTRIRMAIVACTNIQPKL